MAESKRDEFYPDAEVYSDHREMLTRDDIEVVDVTPHPEDRLSLLEDCIHTGNMFSAKNPMSLILMMGTFAALAKGGAQASHQPERSLGSPLQLPAKCS